MNTPHRHDSMHESPQASPNDAAHDFDERLRQAHARAVESVSPRTRVHLRPERASAARSIAPSRRHAWPLAATCAIALVAAGLFLRHPESVTPAPDAPSLAAAQENTDAGDVYTALDESPDLYLWLASNDTENLVTE